MTDDAAAASPNPFDQMAEAAEKSPTPDTNPFDAMADKLGAGGDVADGSSAKGSFGRAAVRGVVPAAAGLAGAGAGAEIGAAAGMFTGPLAPIASPVLGLGGAVVGGLLASYGAGKAQDYALKQLPDSWTEAIGQDDRQQQLDEKLHPNAAMLGGLVPYALTMHPSLSMAARALPENATNIQRLMANPVTARLFGGAFNGGMEMGQESIAGQSPDWTKVAIATGFGAVFNKPTRLGERLTSFGASPFAPFAEAARTAAQARVVGKSLQGEPEWLPEAWRPGYTDPDPVTLAAAGDAKILGPGITEEVFQGTQEQHPDAAMSVQEQRRAELPPPVQDIHDIARRMHPETFDRYDELLTQRASLAAAVDHPVSGEAARAHLAATDADLRALSPEIAAAYRRASDVVGAQSVEQQPASPAPTPFKSLVEMIAARDTVPAEQPAIVQPSQEGSGLVSGDTPQISPPQRSMEQQRASIATDVTQKLLDAGRPEAEAIAGGNLLAARYATRAERMGGALGNAEDLYRREGPIIRGPRPAPRELPPNLPPDDLRAMLARRAGADELAEHPQFAEAAKNMSYIQPMQEIWGPDPKRPSEQWQAERTFNFPDGPVTGYEAGVSKLVDKAESYSTDGPVRADRRAFIVIGPPAAGKSTISERIAQREKASIVDSDDAKAVLPEYQGGIGANAVHEESGILSARVLANQVQNGHNIVIPKVGDNQGSISGLTDRLKAKGYDIHLINLNVTPDEAFRRMVGRFTETGRLINPDYFRSIGWKPTETFNALKNDERISSHAEIDGNGPRDNQPATGVGDALAAVSDEERRQRELGLGHDDAGMGSARGGAEPPEVNAAAPVADVYEAADRLNQMTVAQQKRVLPAYSEAADAGIPQRGADHPAGVFMFDPTQLNVDASRFQFKSGGDEYGVTGALRNVTKWDPAKAQAIMVWEQADGKLFVADGHQRSGLARRLTEQGKAPEGGIDLPGILYREKDGITADDVRALAAVTNIANGSGSALDGAKVLRARPDLMDGSLPLSAGKGGQAASLARLGDEAFRMVVNDVVPEHYGSIVGDLLPNDPDRQVAAMKAIARFEPRNAEEAAVLTQRVAQAELEKANAGAQTSMFGDLETPESTAGEEMKIVGRAIKDLKKDKALFSRVVANAERIEETGSTIERSTAESVASDSEVFAKTLASSAYSAGPLRDALVAAAKDLKSGDIQVGEASSRILAALRGSAEENGPDGARLGRRPEQEAEAREYAQDDEGGVESATEPGAEGLPQQLVPGVAPVTMRDKLMALASKPLAPKRAQRDMQADGLFGDGSRQGELFQTARGKIRFGDTSPPIITLMKEANASTFFHETGHQWLEELMADGAHEAAPQDVRADADTVKNWLGVDNADDIKTRHHEKFARGFEQYLREGVAPSPGLAGVFAKFRDWLTNIYQTVTRLGAPINEDIRGVFDRMLSTEPQRTVIADERPAGGPTLADIHEADAQETEPHEAAGAQDRSRAERARFLEDLAASEHGNELAPALAQAEAAIAQQSAGRPAGAGTGDVGAGQDGAGSGGRGQVGDGGGDAGPLANGGEPRQSSLPLSGGVGEARPESDGVSGSEQRPGGAGGDAQHPLAPSPTPVIGRGPSDFVDRAGNIRVENLTTNADVAQAIRDAAEANEGFIGDRRGVITDGQVMDLADALGMDAGKLDQRKLGQAFNAEQIMAARKLLVQSAMQVSEAMKKAATGTEEDILAYAMAKDRHQMIQGQVAGITAEAGRALRAFRSIAGQEETKGVDQFIREATGKTLFQLQEEARLGAQLDSPSKVSKFLNDGVKRSFGRGIMEYFVNNLISGPATHTTYMIGNAALLLEHLGFITPMAAAIGEVKARAAIAWPQLERYGIKDNPDRVRFGEAFAGLRGLASGAAPAVQAVGQAMKTGLTSELPGQAMQENLPLQFTSDGTAAKVDMATRMRDLPSMAYGAIQGMRDGIVANAGLLAAGGVPNAPLIGAKYSTLGVIPDIAYRGVTVLPTGTLARAPGRMVAAIHSFFRVLNYSTDINQQAWRVATSEGHQGEAFAARVAELRQDPTEPMMEAARLKANNLTLMGQAGDFMQKVSKLFNFETDLPVLGNTQPLKFIDPFVQIAGQVVKRSVTEQSPLGLAVSQSVRDDLMGRNGGTAQDLAGAKMLVGSALGMTFAGLAAQSLANGSGPTDPHEKQAWQRRGNQAYSVRIGDTWYGLHRLGPLGVLVGLGADMHDISHTASEGDLAKAASMFMHSVAINFLDEGFMRGPADLMKAVSESERYGTRYVGNLASSFIPWSTGMAQMTRSMDPYALETRTVMDSIRSKIPGHLDSFFSEGLYPRRDVWGEPISTLDAVGGAGVTAIYESKVNNDPVEKALSDLSIYPAPLGQKFRGVQLTEGQYDDYTRLAGRMTKQRLDTIVGSPDWQSFPNSAKVAAINEVRRQSREIAANMLMAKYPTLPTEAYALKVAKMNGQKKP